MGLRRDYNDPLYKTFRKKVRNRDKKCRWLGCGKRRRLQVHHILPWGKYPNLRYDPNNGITLCKAHHRQVTGSEHHYTKIFTDIIKNGL
jgi:5-methylcytosine-specific restriction endonuclease McrA